MGYNDWRKIWGVICIVACVSLLIAVAVFYNSKSLVGPVILFVISGIIWLAAGIVWLIKIPCPYCGHYIGTNTTVSVFFADVEFCPFCGKRLD